VRAEPMSLAIAVFVCLAIDVLKQCDVDAITSYKANGDPTELGHGNARSARWDTARTCA